MAGRETSFAELFGRMRTLVSHAPSLIVGGVVVLAGIGVGIDQLSRGGGLTFGYSIVSLILQCLVTIKLLERLELVPQGYQATRIFSVFGLGIGTGLGIFLGAIFLVVPGIYLAVRWSVCVPVLLCENTGVTEAMSRSWDETSGRLFPIFLLLGACYLPAIAGVGLLVWTSGFQEAGQSQFFGNLLVNLAFAASSVLGWVAAVAVYSERHDTPKLAEVFA